MIIQVPCTLHRTRHGESGETDCAGRVGSARARALAAIALEPCGAVAARSCGAADGSGSFRNGDRAAHWVHARPDQPYPAAVFGGGSRWSLGQAAFGATPHTQPG